VTENGAFSRKGTQDIGYLVAVAVNVKWRFRAGGRGFPRTFIKFSPVSPLWSMNAADLPGADISHVGHCHWQHNEALRAHRYSPCIEILERLVGGLFPRPMFHTGQILPQRSSTLMIERS